jgi:DNA sulfur modification protein DndB
MLSNIFPAEELRGLASRKSKADEYKTVRKPLVDEEIAAGWVIDHENASTSRLRKPKSHNRLLEDRVWTLMYRMGFGHLSGAGGASQRLNSSDVSSPENQIDVVAIDDEICLAVECKSSEKPKKFADFSTVLAKHLSLKDKFSRAVGLQLAVPHKRVSRFAVWTMNIIVSDNDKSRAATANVTLLDDKDLEYYEQLVGQVGAAARYQFLADVLQGRGIPGLEIKVPAIRAKIGGSVSYSFSISPEYLLKIAFVSHRSRGKASDIDAYQRLLKKSRLKSIRQYITEGGIFPTNIVVNVADSRWLTFDKGKQEGEDKSTTFGWLNIRPAYRVAWIIDGQHRLFAYADHALARKSLISVIAFVGLQPSEQARLFVDINAEQRKVKQSLLQELYAELHWDADDPEVRVQAILSKVIQALDTDLRSPLVGRVLKADDARTDTRCVSLTSIFRAMEKAGFFVARVRKGTVLEYGPLWDHDNQATMQRTIALLIGYFDVIKSEAADLWEKGSGEGGGLSMNDGVTVCLNLLRSIFHHLQTVKRIKLADLATAELLSVVEPYAKKVGKYFQALSVEQMVQFRALRGIQGQTTGTRRVEESLQISESAFDPPGLREFLSREKAQTTTRAFEQLQAIERILQSTILSELKSEFGEDETGWWFSGVPKSVRKKIDDRINEEGGKGGGREDKFDLIDYRDIAEANWPLFEPTLARGKGNKQAKTKWLVEVNDLRKPVVHASRGQSMPITEEQLAFLEEIHVWLQAQFTEPLVEA